MEEITYQGAYIRTITMIILEHLVNMTKTLLLKGEEITLNLRKFIDSIENIIIGLLDINFSPKYEKADMPYSEKHRVKLRAWQTLIVLIEFIDPLLYNQHFR